MRGISVRIDNAGEPLTLTLSPKRGEGTRRRKSCASEEFYFRAASVVCIVVGWWNGLDSRCNAQTAEPQIAATVANQVITVEQAEKFLARTLDDRPLSEEVKTLLQAKALEQLVGELLVIEYFRGENKLASDDDVQLALERFQDELTAVEQSLDQYMAEQGLTKNGLLNQIRFRLSWEKYLAETLTDTNLQKHFERFRRELDGTQMRVSHLLLKIEGTDADAVARIREQAATIRQQIIAGKMAWADAVQDHSQAPSRESGGDLRWIERFAPMPEAFSKAAFALEVGEISPPIQTEFGIHLIRCDAIEPGQHSWDQVEPALRRHATQYLFDWIAERQRPKSPPIYSGSFPRLDPKTGQAVRIAR